MKKEKRNAIGKLLLLIVISAISIVSLYTATQSVAPKHRQRQQSSSTESKPEPQTQRHQKAHPITSEKTLSHHSPPSLTTTTEKPLDPHNHYRHIKPTKESFAGIISTLFLSYPHLSSLRSYLSSPTSTKDSGKIIFWSRVLLVVICLATVICRCSSYLRNRLVFYPYRIVHYKEWHRFFVSFFINLSFSSFISSMCIIATLIKNKSLSDWQYCFLLLYISDLLANGYACFYYRNDPSYWHAGPSNYDILTEMWPLFGMQPQISLRHQTPKIMIIHVLLSLLPYLTAYPIFSSIFLHRIINRPSLEKSEEIQEEQIAPETVESELALIWIVNLIVNLIINLIITIIKQAEKIMPSLLKKEVPISIIPPLVLLSSLIVASFKKWTFDSVKPIIASLLLVLYKYRVIQYDSTLTWQIIRS